MEEDRLLTSKENSWVNKLRKCLSEIPTTLELNVGHGEIKVCNEGAIDRAIEIGSSDDLVVITYLKTKRVFPDSESR